MVASTITGWWMSQGRCNSMTVKGQYVGYAEFRGSMATTQTALSLLGRVGGHLLP